MPTADGATSEFSVSLLKETAMQGFLMVDPGSMEALHIFREESHPGAMMGIGQFLVFFLCCFDFKFVHRQLREDLETNNETTLLRTTSITPPTGTPKEGLSVFGILNKCITPLGRNLLRVWFARPLIDVATIQERQDGVEFLIKVADVCGPLR